MAKTIIITSGQSIFDIALQLGYQDKVYELIQLNIGKIPNITTQDLTGLQIEYVEQNNYSSNYFRDKKIVISTKANNLVYRITENDIQRILENNDIRTIE